MFFSEDADFCFSERVDLEGQEEAALSLGGQFSQTKWPFPSGSETQQSVVLRTLFGAETVPCRSVM